MKTHILQTAFALALMATALACQQGAKPIDYGNQACDYCRMSIVDERYAAQLVSDKNKTYSFDAIECMINFKHENADGKWQQELVTDYSNPRKLIPADGAVIVRSKDLPSPMGAYLTAVANRAAAEKLLEKNNGKTYTYPQVADGLEDLPEL